VHAASPLEGYVQYKVSWENLTKCGFPQCTNLDDPRLHMYHRQVTHEIWGEHFNSFGTQTTTNFVTNDCGGWAWVYPGSYTNYYGEDLEPTLDETEWQTGHDPHYTNSYSGAWVISQLSEDTRTWDGSDCSHQFYCDAYTYGLRDRPLTAQYIDIGGSMAWRWVGQDYFLGKLRECAWTNTVTTETTNSLALEIVLPPSDLLYWRLDAITLTNAVYILPPEIFEPQGVNGTCRFDLSQEYTDDELRGRILALMPAYPQEWYTPNGTWYDLFNTIAYSVIDGDHVNAHYWWDPEQPELQKMKYRFAVPGSQARATYRITWDLVTWDTTTGAVAVRSQSCQVSGTGDPVEPAYSRDFEELPPYWDDSRQAWGGWVITWVDHVVITMASGTGDTGCPPGDPGPLLLAGPRPADGGCGGATPCAASPGTAVGVAASFGLGQSLSGYGAGSLTLAADQPSLSLASPSALSFTASTQDVEVISISGQLRQVNAPQALADIVTSNAFAYEIRYYLPGQVGAIVGGVHQVSGNPFLTWKIENPDASTNSCNRLRLTEIQGSDARIYDYVYTASNTSWKLDYPGGLREDECVVSTATNGTTVTFGGWNELPGFTRTVTATTRVPGGAEQFKVQRVYEMTDWGEALVRETLSPDSNPQTTTYIYDPTYPARYGGPRLQKIIRPDGSWQWFTYDGLGRYTSVYSAQGDVPPDGDNPPGNVRRTDYYYWPDHVDDSGDDGTVQPDTPRYVVEKQNAVNGNLEVSGHHTVFPSAGLRIDAQTTAPYVSLWYDATSLFTTNRYYTNGPNANRLKSVVNPDGTLQTFDYAADATGFYRTNIGRFRPPGRHLLPCH
jgi:YD repeat-containing protein